MENNRNKINNGKKWNNEEGKKGYLATILFVFPYLHVYLYYILL